MNYYKTSFALHYHHNYSLSEIENMLPWELSILITMIQAQMQKEAEQRELRRQQQRYAR